DTTPTCVLGSLRLSISTEQNTLERVSNCACTSSPITASYRAMSTSLHLSLHFLDVVCRQEQRHLIKPRSHELHAYRSVGLRELRWKRNRRHARQTRRQRAQIRRIHFERIVCFGAQFKG